MTKELTIKIMFAYNMLLPASTLALNVLFLKNGGTEVVWRAVLKDVIEIRTKD
jgi:hypothetical protein